jgi:hypothetical protein
MLKSFYSLFFAISLLSSSAIAGEVTFICDTIPKENGYNLTGTVAVDFNFEGMGINAAHGDGSFRPSTANLSKAIDYHGQIWKEGYIFLSMVGSKGRFASLWIREDGHRPKRYGTLKFVNETTPRQVYCDVIYTNK